jgi:hypothetical protein
MVSVDDLCVCNPVTHMELNPISTHTLKHQILNSDNENSHYLSFITLFCLSVPEV